MPRCCATPEGCRGTAVERGKPCGGIAPREGGDVHREGWGGATQKQRGTRVACCPDRGDGG